MDTLFIFKWFFILILRQMEKLIKLLDEFDHRKTKDIEWWKNWCIQHQEWIISKRCCFIYWLVYHKKIDYTKCFHKNILSSMTTQKLNNDQITDELIMKLSVQDKPLEFLVSILK